MSTAFSERLNKLFDEVRVPRSGREYTNNEVAEAISARGASVSSSYLWQLRNGRKDNPTLRHIEALAEFFDVPPAYFLDEETAQRVDKQLADVRAERSRLDDLLDGSDVAVMALRAGELSDEGRRQVMELVNFVHKLEHPDSTQASAPADQPNGAVTNP